MKEVNVGAFLLILTNLQPHLSLAANMCTVVLPPVLKQICTCLVFIQVLRLSAVPGGTWSILRQTPGSP